MNVHNTFPTPIGIFKIDNSDKLNKGLSDYILSLKREDNPQRSMVGGYHTKEDLLNHNNNFIHEFRRIIVDNAQEYYGKKFGINSKMVAWAMIYEPNNYSKPHTHPLADISTAYYCKVPQNIKGGEFSIIDPRPAAKNDVRFADDSVVTITPEEGTGIIFPGWLDHYVEPHKSNELRICITTNIFIDHGTFFK